MDHGGESPRTMRAESIELRMPATIVQGAEPGINTDMFDEPSAPYPQILGQVRTSAEVLAAVFRGELGLGVVHADDLLRDPVQENYHYYELQPQQGASHGDVFLVLLPDGRGGVSRTFTGFAGAERAKVLAIGMRPGGVGGVSSTFTGFAGAQRAEVLAVRPMGGVSPTFAGFAGAQRAEVLAVGMRPDSVGGVFRTFTGFASAEVLAVSPGPDGVGGVSPTFTGFAGAQRAEVLAVGLRPDGVGGVCSTGAPCAELLVVGLLPDGVGEVPTNYTGFAGAQRAVGLRPDGVGVVPINSGSFVGAHRGEVVVGLRPDGVGGAASSNYGGNTHLMTLAGTGRTAGIIGELHASNLGLAYDGSSAELAYDSLRTVFYDGSPGTLAERIRRFLPMAGVLASSAAVTGVMSAGAVTPAAGLGSFALLLAGLAMIMIHVLRA